MSGIFGFVDLNHKTDPQDNIQKLASSITHQDSQICEWYVDVANCLSLGRIGIGIFNSRTQPIVDEINHVVLFMSGEIYEVDGTPVEGDLDATERTVLATYLKYGDDFARYLNGAFAISIWDRKNRKVIVTNDRFGLYPIFFYLKTGNFIFSPEINGIFCDGSIEKTLDMTALAQYVRFQQLLGERTFFDDVQLLASASVLSLDIDSGSSKIRSYWSINEIPYDPQISFNEASEEAGRLLRLAIRRLSNDSHQPGVYLSGGMDSRTILGLIDRRPIPSITYGKHDCRDVYYAGKISDCVGSDHTWVDLPDGNWVKEYFDHHLVLTEGLHSWIHMHGISTLEVAHSKMDVNLTGWGAGPLRGAAVEPRVTNAVDESARIQRLYQRFTHDLTWPSIDESEEYLLFNGDYKDDLKGIAFESFRQEYAKYAKYRDNLRGEYFIFKNHDGRLTFNMVTFYRSQMEVRFPYVDLDLITFIYSFPPNLRSDQRLFRSIIHREIPKLSLIPYERNEFLPMPDNWLRRTHALTVRLKRRINKHLYPVFRERPILNSDYEDYVRRDLRTWVENILFDERTKDRGIFNQSFLRSLMARHCSGNEQWTIGKIAPLLTYEMMVRKFVD